MSWNMWDHQNVPWRSWCVCYKRRWRWTDTYFFISVGIVWKFSSLASAKWNNTFFSCFSDLIYSKFFRSGKMWMEVSHLQPVMPLIQHQYDCKVFPVSYVVIPFDQGQWAWSICSLKTSVRAWSPHLFPPPTKNGLEGSGCFRMGDKVNSS